MRIGGRPAMSSPSVPRTLASTGWLLACVLTVAYGVASLWLILGVRVPPQEDLMMTIAASQPKEVRARSDESMGRITLGYFHGGRTAPLFRAALARRFLREDLQITLRTRNLSDKSYFDLHAKQKEFRHLFKSEREERKNSFGKVTGEELLEEMAAGRTDGACVGESSFLAAVAKGMPIVAVVALAHDTEARPGHAIVLREGLKVKTPADLRGLRLVARRAGPGDEVFLREFLVQNGLDPDKDVQLSVKMDDDQMVSDLDSFDGGYYHLLSLRDPVQRGKAFVYRRFDWVNPALSTSLVVFPRAYVERHREDVMRLVRGLTTQLVAESLLRPEERLKNEMKGFQIAMDFQGMDLPQADLPPRVRLDLLGDMQRLLVKHGILKEAVDLRPYVDESFVDEVEKEIPTIRETLEKGNVKAVKSHRAKHQR